MQSDVRRAYEDAKMGDGTATIVVNSADAAWRFSNSQKQGDLFAKTLSVKRQANPIIMSSVIVPLPHLLSLKGKLDLAGDYCRIFEEMGVPYQAVIHAPVKGKNDLRNWHMHINYYPFQASQTDGFWSFEKEQYRCAKSRKVRTRPRGKSPRHPATKAENGWVDALKAKMCNHANGRLSEEGFVPYFTMMTNEERGRGSAEKRRGPKASANRSQGETAPARAELNAAEWDRFIANALRLRSLRFKTRFRRDTERLRADDMNAVTRSAVAGLRYSLVSLKAHLMAMKIRSGFDFVSVEQERVLNDPASRPAKRAIATHVTETLKMASPSLNDQLAALDRVRQKSRRLAARHFFEYNALLEDRAVAAISEQATLSDAIAAWRQGTVLTPAPTARRRVVTPVGADGEHTRRAAYVVALGRSLGF